MKSQVLIICNADSKEYFEQVSINLKISTTFIVSRPTFDQYVRSNDMSTTQSCWIQSELTWNNNKGTNYLGFEIAKKLRLAGALCTIHLMTFLPKTKFDYTSPEFILLNVPTFHKIINLPLLPIEQLNTSAKLMSKDLREDIVHSLLDTDSLITEILHDLKNKVISHKSRFVKIDNERIMHAIDKAFLDLNQLLPHELDSLQDIKRRLLSEIEQTIGTDGLEKVQDVIEAYSFRIKNLAPSFQEHNIPIKKFQTKWKVLFVDDDENVRTLMKSAFEHNNISFEIASSSKDAFDILEKDRPRNDITLLLCDIRLKDEKTGLWDIYQGYDIIHKVHKEFPSYITFFALTSGKRRALQFKKDSQLKIATFLKQDALRSKATLQLFLRQLREAGNEMYYKSRSKPVLSSWTKGNATRFASPLGLYYREHLMARDYKLAEERISGQAFTYVDNVLKDKVSEDNSIQFTGTLKNDSPFEKSGLMKFRSRTLVGRRIALALYLNHHSEEDILRIMQGNEEFRNIRAAKNLLFKTSFALSFQKDLPDRNDIKNGAFLRSHLLEEEITWLKENFDIDFNLTALRFNQRDIDKAILILGDLQYTLKNRKAPPPKESSLSKKHVHYINTNINSVGNPKKIKALFLDANKLAKYHMESKQFNESIEEELERIENKNFKAFLHDLLFEQD